MAGAWFWTKLSKGISTGAGEGSRLPQDTSSSSPPPSYTEGLRSEELFEELIPESDSGMECKKIRQLHQELPKDENLPTERTPQDELRDLRMELNETRKQLRESRDKVQQLRDPLEQMRDIERETRLKKELEKCGGYWTSCKILTRSPSPLHRKSQRSAGCKAILPVSPTSNKRREDTITLQQLFGINIPAACKRYQDYEIYLCQLIAKAEPLGLIAATRNAVTDIQFVKENIDDKQLTWSLKAALLPMTFLSTINLEGMGSYGGF